MNIALAAALALALLLAYAAASTAVGRYDSYLEGMWSGDPGYLGTAQLSDFQLYIGPRTGRTRQGYLLMVDADSGVVANTAFTLEEPGRPTRWLAAAKNAYRRRDACTLPVQITPDGDAPFPASLRLTVSILDGTLTLHDSQTVYAFLEKDMAASAAAAS